MGGVAVQARDADLTDALAEQVRRAAAARAPLRIVGGDTKAFYGRKVGGRAAEPRRASRDRRLRSQRAGDHGAGRHAARRDRGRGSPSTASGWRSSRRGSGRPARIGGVVAAGLAGPRRPFAGAVRDCVLGATILDGAGRRLRFGGQVFKNVAGFDAFRLQAGALG